MKKDEYQKLILEIIVKIKRVESLKIIYEFLKGMGLGK